MVIAELSKQIKKSEEGRDPHNRGQSISTCREIWHKNKQSREDICVN
jgi:hypothetical protein